MKRIFFCIIFLLIFLETSIAASYPYYSVALSYLGYLVYKKEKEAFFYGFIIVFFIGLSSPNIEYTLIFFLIYGLILYYLYKHLMYSRVNVIIISLVEIVLYIVYVYLFRVKEVLILNWLKGFLFISFYNFLFYWYEKNLSRRVQ